MNALGLAITLLLSASPCERGADCPAESTCVERICLEGSGKVRVATLARVAVERPIITPSTPELERRAARLARHVEHALDWSGFYEVKGLHEHPRTPRRESMSPAVRALWRTFGVERVVRLHVRASASPGAILVKATVVNTQDGRILRLGARDALVPPGGDRHVVARWINGLVADDTGLASSLGSRLLVSVEVAPGRKEIGVVESDGVGLSFVTRNGSINVMPAWGPKGAVGYMSYAHGNPDWVVNGQRFSTRPGLNAAGAWSPDGAFLALSVAEAANSDIVLLDAKTGREHKRLTSHAGVDTSPAWSPDGARLAFVSDRTGSPQVWIAEVKSGDLRMLSEGGYAASPVWSPLGTSLVFVQLIAGKGVLYRHDFDTKQVHRLTDTSSDADSPTISPDGRYVVFVQRSKAQRAALLRVPLYGGNVRPLAQQAWPLYAPDWQH